MEERISKDSITYGLEVGSEKFSYFGNMNNRGFFKVHMNILRINFSDTESSSMNDCTENPK